MKVLILCSGTGSLDRAFAEEGWNVTSVDIDPKSCATYTADICEWQPPVGETWDCIWASPPCTEFSRALTTRPRRLEEGLRIALRCLDLVIQLRPTVWFIEKPGTGLLPKQRHFETLPCDYVTYCKYGYPYKKLTWIANNCSTWHPRIVCCNAYPCTAMLNGRHPECAQRGPSRGKGGLYGSACSLAQLYSLPPVLCHEIAQAAGQHLRHILHPLDMDTEGPLTTD